MSTTPKTVKILGDHTLNEFLKEIKVTEIIGMSYSFSFVSTMTSLSLEIDPHGTETIMIIGCLTSIYDRMVAATEREMGSSLDKIRLLFDAYLTRSHEIYVCPPLGRSSSRITSSSQKVAKGLNVRGFLKFMYLSYYLK